MGQKVTLLFIYKEDFGIKDWYAIKTKWLQKFCINFSTM